MSNQAGDDLRRQEQQLLVVALSEAPQREQPAYLRRLGDIGDLDALEEVMLYLASTNQAVVEAAVDAVGRIQRRAAESQALGAPPLPPPLAPPPYVPPGASTTTTTVTYTVTRSAPPPPPPPPRRADTRPPTEGALRAARKAERAEQAAARPPTEGALRAARKVERAEEAAARPPTEGALRAARKRDRDAHRAETAQPLPPPPPPTTSGPAPGDSVLITSLEAQTVRGVGQPEVPVSAPVPSLGEMAAGVPPLPAIAALPPRFEDRNLPKIRQDGMS